MIKPNRPSAFPSSSRYFASETAEYKPTPDAQPVTYIRRRFLSSASRFTPIGVYTVKQGDRLDNITASFLGDPEQFWRLCDANNALEPDDLTDTPGETITITLPEGMQGPSA